MILQAESAFEEEALYMDVYEDFKFISFREFVSFDMGFKSDPFPKWATPDPDNNLILLELNQKNALGIHYIYAQMSYKVPDDAFVGLPGIENIMDSISLKTDLIEKGYIDRESFNSDFDYSERLKLDIELSPNEGVVKKEKVVDLISEELYDSLLMTGILNKINETHSFIDPDYSGY
mmetsp:Transcript_25794/g.39647  ORF Transcript_25794/g.39647 Transcript_25794/m.39647 type:complete len:177 (-) Transcript_25794:2122-2652(-)